LTKRRESGVLGAKESETTLRATMVSEASPPIAEWRPETPFAKVRRAEGDFL